MDGYIKELTDVIENGSMDNTYKMSWIRSIVESCEKSTKSKIHFDELSELIFKYYWNQSIFFKLQQGPNSNKKPKIFQLVEQSIDEYQSKYGMKPETFIKVQEQINIPTKQISTVLTKDVCERFLNLDKNVLNIYKYNLEERTIDVLKPSLIKEYSNILYSLINYRWTQKLEDIDGSPRISKKIKGVDREKTPVRKSLKQFHRFIDLENPYKRCFISGKKIPEGKLSVDHVIPWSYMFSDDLWNLVYVNSSENSSKNNRLPNKDMVQKLIVRNKKLLKLMRGNNINSKHEIELDISLKRNYVDLYWTGFRG
jgi:hypothetical protein